MWILWAAAGCAITPHSPAADFSASLSAGYAFDSNAFELAGIEGDPIVDGQSGGRDDSSRTLAAGVSGLFGGNGPTQLRLNATFSRVESGHFEALDRNDYTFGGTLDWRPSRAFDATLEYTQDRLPLSLADLGITRTTQQRTRQAQATLRVRPTPRWQIGAEPARVDYEAPLPAAPRFELHENSGTATLDYLGAGRVVPGLSVTGTRGKYTGIEDATRYRQRTLQGTLSYQATGFSSFDLALGHTRRTTSLINPSADPDILAREGTDSALTGGLNYHRQLSVKTGIDITAYRSFQHYDAGVNTSVGTGLNFSLNWAPTAKLAFNLGSALNWSTIQDVRDAALGGTGERKDLVRSFSFTSTYQATRMVSLRAHYERRIRRSEVWVDQFNNTRAGLELTVRID